MRGFAFSRHIGSFSLESGWNSWKIDHDWKLSGEKLSTIDQNCYALIFMWGSIAIIPTLYLNKKSYSDIKMQVLLPQRLSSHFAIFIQFHVACDMSHVTELIIFMRFVCDFESLTCAIFVRHGLWKIQKFHKFIKDNAIKILTRNIIEYNNKLVKWLKIHSFLAILSAEPFWKCGQQLKN